MSSNTQNTEYDPATKSTAGLAAPEFTTTELRKLASKHGAKRAKLLVKFRDDELTADDEIALLRATFDYAQVRIDQGNRVGALPLFDDGLILATAFFSHQGAEPQFIAQLKRLPPLYFPRLVLRLTAEQCKALYDQMSEKERVPCIDELVADRLDQWFFELIKAGKTA
jgi:hypothetical protein